MCTRWPLMVIKQKEKKITKTQLLPATFFTTDRPQGLLPPPQHLPHHLHVSGSFPWILISATKHMACCHWGTSCFRAECHTSGKTARPRRSQCRASSFYQQVGYSDFQISHTLQQNECQVHSLGILAWWKLELHSEELAKKRCTQA